MKTWRKIAIGVVVGFILGFIMAKQYSSDITIDYKPLPPIIVDPGIPDPIETLPDNPDYPDEVLKPKTVVVKEIIEIDGGYRELYMKVCDSLTVTRGKLNMVIDSLAVLNDWSTERLYKNWVLYDIDTVGRFQMDLYVQFNRAQRVENAILSPIQKTVTITKRPLFIPYASVSTLVLPDRPGYVGVGGGAFYKNIGVEYQYMIGSSQPNGHLIKLNLKFGK